jgi:hypothetical protein
MAAFGPRFELDALLRPKANLRPTLTPTRIRLNWNDLLPQELSTMKEIRHHGIPAIMHACTECADAIRETLNDEGGSTGTYLAHPCYALAITGGDPK